MLLRPYQIMTKTIRGCLIWVGDVKQQWWISVISLTLQPAMSLPSASFIYEFPDIEWKKIVAAKMKSIAHEESSIHNWHLHRFESNCRHIHSINNAWVRSITLIENIRCVLFCISVVTFYIITLWPSLGINDVTLLMRFVTFYNQSDELHELRKLTEKKLIACVNTLRYI